MVDLTIREGDNFLSIGENTLHFWWLGEIFSFRNLAHRFAEIGPLDTETG